MKAITNTQTTISGDTITIVGKLVDFKRNPIQAQKVSVLQHVQTNPHKPRRAMLGSEGFIVERHGSQGFCFPLAEMAAVAIEADISLTDAPRFDKHPGLKETTTVSSELPATVRWMQSADEGATWAEVPQPRDGAPGTWLKAVASNKAGSTDSATLIFPPAKADAAQAKQWQPAGPSLKIADLPKPQPKESPGV